LEISLTMKLETWVSLASIGLSAMFVALIISLYSFLIGPGGQGPSRVVDPGGLLIQQVSISAAPSVILAAFVFALTRTTGSRSAGLLLLGAGIIMLAGMLYTASSLLPSIPKQYVVGGVGQLPYMFAVAGAIVAGLGAYLAVRKKQAMAGNLDDLR
jgi:hypothetical protein